MSETPAELILFDGEPDLSLIPDTNVLWATNTESDLFLSSHDGSYYYLVSGRWFRADDLMQGPWTFVSDRVSRSTWSTTGATIPSTPRVVCTGGPISYRPLRGRFDEGPSKGPAVS